MDKAALFRDRLPQREVSIPDVGVVTVRAISRYEQMVFTKAAAGDVTVFDRKQLAAAMVDPPMSEEDAGRWLQAAPAGEVAIVIEVIGELSGTDREVRKLQKEAFLAFRGD